MNKGYKCVSRFGDYAICMIEISYSKSKRDKMHKYARYTENFYIESITNTENGVDLESVLAFTAVGIPFLYEVRKYYQNRRTYFYPASIEKAKDFALKFGEYRKLMQSKLDSIFCQEQISKLQFSDGNLTDKERTELNKMLFNEFPHKDHIDQKLEERRLEMIDAFILGEDY